MRTLALLLISMLFWRCSHNGGTTTRQSDPGCVSDELLGMSRQATVQIRPVISTKSLAGKVSFDESSVVPVFPLLGGVVTTVSANLGDFVRKGAVLAMVRSADVAGLQDDHLDAMSDLAIAKKQLDATKELAQSGLAAQKEVTYATENYSKAKARADKTREVLRIFSAGHDASYALVAPASGYIVAKNVKNGMQLRQDNTEPAFVIGSIDQVWVLADVFEADLATIAEGQKVEVSSMALPNKKFSGTISKLSEVIDPESRTLKARIVLDNKAHALKPEMYATVNVLLEEGLTMPAVPNKALVFDDGQNYVVEYKDRCNLKIWPVTIYTQNDSLTYVANLPAEVRQIVSQNSLNLYSALKQQAR